MSKRIIRSLVLDDMDEAAALHRASFDRALPWLASLHTPQEDQAFFRDRVFRECQVWGSFDGARLAGFIAFRDGWIDQLYIAPDSQRQGIGGALLQVAQEAFPRLSLWTFQRNAPARAFYEGRGFVAVRETDGAGNDEKEPDVLYAWAA